MRIEVRQQTNILKHKTDVLTPKPAAGDFVEAREINAAPRIAIDEPWGRFLLNAYALDDDGASPVSRAAIHIRRQQPMILKLAEAMGKFDISSQQREVALLLAQGRSNQQIGATLNVSGNTVNYHIKQLFMRLDAHDRVDAVAKMLADA